LPNAARAAIIKTSEGIKAISIQPGLLLTVSLLPLSMVREPRWRGDFYCSTIWRQGTNKVIENLAFFDPR